MGEPVDNDRFERRSRAYLVSALEADGWSVHEDPRDKDQGVDLIAEKAGRSYWIELRWAHDARRPILKGLLADACLQARHYAGRGGHPLAVVGAPHLSRSILEDLREYAGRFLAECAYGLVDLGLRGVELHGAGLEHIGPRHEIGEHVVHPRRVAPVDLFSDIGRWLIKVLLAERIPAELLNAPRLPIRNAKHLAEVAAVSVPSAWRQIDALDRAAFLENSPGRIRLVRIGDLLREWLRRDSRGERGLPMRWILPPSDGEAELRAAILRHQAASRPEGGIEGPGSRPDICLSGFSASRQLGLGIVQGVPSSIYLRPKVSLGVIEALGLREVSGDSASRVDVIAALPRFPRSVLRAAVIRDGIAVADVVQCWLDVAGNPARGEEQAREIWDRVLGRLEE